MRVIEHPILGDLEDKKKVTLYYNGEPIEALEGEPIASALMNAGIGYSGRQPSGMSPEVFSVPSADVLTA